MKRKTLLELIKIFCVAMYDSFSAFPDRAAKAKSAPLNVFRNIERYCLEHYDKNSAADLYLVRTDAWTKTLYAKDRLLEHAIPSYLLHDHIVQSHLLSQTQSYPINVKDISLPIYRHSTVTSCHHENYSLVIHCGGKDMDELIVRDAVSILYSQYFCRSIYITVYMHRYDTDI